MRALASDRPWRREAQSGFTYLMLLWWVFISGVMLMALAQTWSMQSRRARETEMVFRAEQIVKALTSYQQASPDGAAKLPSRMEDLLEDRRAEPLKRHLRKLWPDPVTGGEWGILREGDEITGVYSTSERAPLAAPDGVHSYQEWYFMVTRVVMPASGASAP